MVPVAALFPLTFSKIKLFIFIKKGEIYFRELICIGIDFRLKIKGKIFKVVQKYAHFFIFSLMNKENWLDNILKVIWYFVLKAISSSSEWGYHPLSSPPHSIQSLFAIVVNPDCQLSRGCENKHLSSEKSISFHLSPKHHLCHIISSSLSPRVHSWSLNLQKCPPLIDKLNNSG